MILRISVLLLTQILYVHACAQVEYLRLSPSQKIIQRVGMTDIELEFSRPQMKGRLIFGGLVPYGNMWRTGANENTLISFSHRVKIGEKEVAKGTYSLLTKPMKQSWDIFLYTDLDNLDVPNPIDSSKLIYLTTVKSYELQHMQETLVINLYDLTENTANLGISWEKTAVKIPISFYTQEAMEQRMEKEFTQNIMDYKIAVSYYAQRGLELEKAKSLQELVIRLKEKPSAWDLHNYGLILYKLGETEQAKEQLEKSLQLAKDADIEYLILENQSLLGACKK